MVRLRRCECPFMPQDIIPCTDGLHLGAVIHRLVAQMKPCGAVTAMGSLECIAEIVSCGGVGHAVPCDRLIVGQRQILMPYSGFGPYSQLYTHHTVTTGDNTWQGITQRLAGRVLLAVQPRVTLPITQRYRRKNRLLYRLIDLQMQRDYRIIDIRRFCNDCLLIIRGFSQVDTLPFIEISITYRSVYLFVDCRQNRQLQMHNTVTQVIFRLQGLGING